MTFRAPRIPNFLKFTRSHLSDLLNILQSASKQKDAIAREEAILLSEIKRDVVRLISNLVYRNKEHQDLVRRDGSLYGHSDIFCHAFFLNFICLFIFLISIIYNILSDCSFNINFFFCNYFYCFV